MQDPASRPFVFTATGAAYFRIWIVNLLLSIVTIGLYSPWAKVRRLRYFYGNTLFDGSPFEFHGRPIALLKGRLIGLVLLIAYSQAAKVSFALWVGVVVVLIALFPWLLWKSFRFRMANSSYRGIRFGFDGSVRDAYLTFVPLMLMVVAPAATLFWAQRLDHLAVRKLPASYGISVLLVLVLAPWFYFRLRAYQHRNARLGNTPFHFDGRARGAYWIAVKVGLLMIGFVLIATVAGGAVGSALYFGLRPVPGSIASFVLPGIGIAVGYLVLLSAGSQPIAMIQNFVWGHTTLGDARFDSQVSRSRLWRIQFVNLFLTLVTLGFFWPFAVVRSMRYRIGALSWPGDSNALVAGAGDAKVGAVGEESADLFGLDIAL